MADNALLSSEFLIYKDLVEASPDLVCRFLPDTTVTFANEALCRALEIERSDLLGRRFFELIPEEEIEPVGDTLAALSPERPSASYLLVFPLTGDDVYIVHWKIRGYFSPEGRLLEVHAFGRDDAERVAANTLLAKRARREKRTAQIIADYAFCKSWSEFNAITERALEVMGAESGAERVNLFQLTTDVIETTHEWRAPGVLSQKELLQQMDANRCAWWIEDIGRNGLFFLPNPDAIERHRGRDDLKRLNIRSLAVFPVEAEGELKGVVSLENIPEDGLSPEMDFPLLSSVSTVIGKTLALLEAGDKLQAADSMYRDIVEKQSELIVRLAPDSTITFCNHAYARFFGKSPEDFIGKKLAHFFSERYEHLSALTPEAPVSTIENRIVMPDGSVRWHVWHDAAFFDGKGCLKEIQAVGWDMTELIAAKQARECERRRALALFENSPEGILASWDGVHIGEANRAFCRMAGCSRDETLGKLFEEVFPVAHGAGALHLKHLVERADSGEPVVEEGVLATKNGRRLFLSVLALPVPDAGESGKGTYLFFRDMTALKENESQLVANIGKLHAAFSQTVEVLALTVESRDPYTAGHQRRTALLSREIARRMGLNEETCCGIFLAAAIHDVGKISVPPEILSRPGKLLDIELSLVKTHAEEGYKILNKVDFPWKIAEIVRQHHERLDGSGYPKGLKNDDIVLEAKIIAVADTVEAMASHRPYRPSLGIETALRFVEEGKGRLFDRLVVEKCQVLFDEGYAFDDCYAPAELLQ